MKKMNPYVIKLAKASFTNTGDFFMGHTVFEALLTLLSFSGGAVPRLPLARCPFTTDPWGGVECRVVI